MSEQIERSPFAAPVARWAEQMSLFAVISAVATDAAEPDDEFVDFGYEDEDVGVELALGPPPPLAGGGSVLEGVTRRDEKRWLRDANATLARDIAKRTA